MVAEPFSLVFIVFVWLYDFIWCVQCDFNKLLHRVGPRLGGRAGSAEGHAALDPIEGCCGLRRTETQPRPSGRSASSLGVAFLFTCKVEEGQVTGDSGQVHFGLFRTSLNVGV